MKKRKGQDSKSSGTGREGFLVEDYQCDIIEVIGDTKFKESLCIRVTGERGTRDFFIGNVHSLPESKNRVDSIQQRFGEIAKDVHRY